jgi:hypothetical protein
MPVVVLAGGDSVLMGIDSEHRQSAHNMLRTCGPLS